MTEVCLTCGADGSFVACSAEGHAGFAARGADIVCAAETAVLRAALAVLGQTKGVVLETDATRRGSLSFSVRHAASGTAERLSCVADFIRSGIGELVREYPGLHEQKRDWSIPVEEYYGS